MARLDIRHPQTIASVLESMTHDENRRALVRRFAGRAEQGRLRPEIFAKLSTSVKELSENDLAKYGGLFERYDVQVMKDAEAALVLAIVNSEWTPQDAREYIDRVDGACWRLWFIRSEL